MQEKVIKQTTFKTIYVCEDGQEFENKHEAQKHEDNLIPSRKIEEYYLTLDSMDSGGGYCYRITEAEDLKYLNAKEWNYHGEFEYEGPGWYLAIFHDGGDYYDTYEIIKVDTYKELLENDLENIKYLTSN